MRVHNLYVDDKGETHFRDLEIEWAEEGPAGKLSKRRTPATGIIFRVEVQPTYDLELASGTAPAIHHQSRCRRADYARATAKRA